MFPLKAARKRPLLLTQMLVNVSAKGRAGESDFPLAASQSCNVRLESSANVVGAEIVATIRPSGERFASRTGCGVTIHGWVRLLEVVGHTCTPSLVIVTKWLPSALNDPPTRRGSAP